MPTLSRSILDENCLSLAVAVNRSSSLLVSALRWLTAQILPTAQINAH
jgi:hypothetical protein